MNRIAGLLVLLLAVSAVGCASRPQPRYWTEAEVIEYNRNRILKLEKGMIQEQALMMMTSRRFPGTVGSVTMREESTPGGFGTPSASAPLGHDQQDYRTYERHRSPIKNPVRKASHKDADGHWIEVYFYFTQELGRKDGVRDAETTPLVFKDGKLIGWGWDFYTDLTNIRPRS